MGNYSSSGPGRSGLGQRIEEVVDRIEMELRQAIAYTNDVAVPQVRRESILAMRTLAETLRNLADRFEASTRQAGSAPHPQPGSTPDPPANPNKDPRN